MFSVKLLNEDSKLPTRGSTGAAGFDLYSTEDILIIPNSSEVVPTGVAFAIPEGYYGLLTHRSSLAFKLDTVASLGIIDSDFVGEVKVKLFNLGAEGVRISKGDRIAQIVISPCMTQMWVVDNLPKTDRGTGGFGSSGK